MNHPNEQQPERFVPISPINGRRQQQQSQNTKNHHHRFRSSASSAARSQTSVLVGVIFLVLYLSSLIVIHSNITSRQEFEDRQQQGHDHVVAAGPADGYNLNEGISLTVMKINHHPVSALINSDSGNLRQQQQQQQQQQKQQQKLPQTPREHELSSPKEITTNSQAIEHHDPHMLLPKIVFNNEKTGHRPCPDQKHQKTKDGRLYYDYDSGYYQGHETCVPPGLGSTTTTPLLVTYYNPFQEERILCNHRIPPQSSIQIKSDSLCREPSHLFKVTLPTKMAAETISDDEGLSWLLPPEIVRFNDRDKKQEPKKVPDCNVPCLKAGHFAIVTKRTIDSMDDLSFTCSMEGPDYYKNLVIDPDDYKRNQYYCTTSFSSEVPLPYYSRAEYNIQHAPLNYDKAIKGAVFVARNCNSRNNREQHVKDLIRLASENTDEKRSLRIESVSSCLHNADPPLGVNLKNKTAIMGKYLFYLAFENQSVNDYITEKLWGSLASGTIPVYVGGPNAREHVPPRSVIFIHDFDYDMKKLYAYMTEVAYNQTLWNSYHAWRKQPFPQYFRDRYDMTNTSGVCRTCRWAMARRYGLGWSHSDQAIQDTKIERQVYMNPEDGTITRPFQEVWMNSDDKETTSLDAHVVKEDEELTESNRVIQVGIGRLRRTVWQKDGVIDIHIDDYEDSGDNSSEDYKTMLVLRTPMQKSSATLKYVESGHLRLQDDASRFTLLTWPKSLSRDVTTSDNVDGSVVVPISSSSASQSSPQIPLRIRIIIEDIDTFHKGADQVENYFGRHMKEDFYNPIQIVNTTTA